MKLWILIFTVFLIPLAEADTIRLRADTWCPYNCKPHSDAPGFLIEIAKEIFEPLGHAIDYQTLSWARAKELGRKGKIEGIVGAYKADAPDFIFPETSQGTSRQQLFVRKDSAWKYTGLESLNGQKIGVINAYTYDDTADALIGKKHPAFVILTADNALEQLIAMLEKKRLTAFYEDPKVVNYRFKQLGKPMDWLEARGNFEPKTSEVFIAFSPKASKSLEYSKILTRGMQTLRENGKLAAILKKYGIEEP